MFWQSFLGFACAACLSRRPPNNRNSLFGIALTGFGMEADIRRSREVGFQHHLVKPIDLNKLDSLIQEGAASLLA